jgi:hypothetical protein
MQELAAVHRRKIARLAGRARIDFRPRRRGRSVASEDGPRSAISRSFGADLPERLAFPVVGGDA